jgi:Protein of unknown function (DUF938)
MGDDRQYAPATLRNRDSILDVLLDVLPKTGVILEIASGSGEHVVYFARNLPTLVFQPSDPEPNALLSVAAWAKAAHVTNVRAPRGCARRLRSVAIEDDLLSDSRAPSHWGVRQHDCLDARLPGNAFNRSAAPSPPWPAN